MFLGYQNDKIAFIANTREELENIPCVSLDRIEETGVDYVLKDGEYKPKSVADKETKTEETIARIEQLKAELVATDYVVLKLSEAQALGDTELYEAYKTKYSDKIQERKEIRAMIDELEEVING